MQKTNVYCGWYRETVVNTTCQVVGDIVLMIDCLECSGTGWWGYGPTENECGPCIDCKGTGKQYLGI